MAPARRGEITPAVPAPAKGKNVSVLLSYQHFEEQYGQHSQNYRLYDPRSVFDDHTCAQVVARDAEESGRQAESEKDLAVQDKDGEGADVGSKVYSLCVCRGGKKVQFCQAGI